MVLAFWDSLLNIISKQSRPIYKFNFDLFKHVLGKLSRNPQTLDLQICAIETIIRILGMNSKDVNDFELRLLIFLVASIIIDQSWMLKCIIHARISRLRYTAIVAKNHACSYQFRIFEYAIRFNRYTASTRKCKYVNENVKCSYMRWYVANIEWLKGELPKIVFNKRQMP